MFTKILADRVARNLPANVGVAVELFDYGARLGVAIRTYPEGPGQKRHAVMVLIERDDLTMAADLAAEALSEWLRSI
jgi:hypothetical protein